ncbi:cyanoexosortase A system-associated protein [Chlorogloea sp. CCALA 695]|uniref:cyanoexosortase A system-associated protein n=1 Tax=Chlorogloea sp. CCALA 695 TaxID=2107693 RepID=UPI000D07ED79|nr:cyanoexosortase A system-associated protein [Chlorogloea sp. CCALA 695]PSB34070.1 cyanoexosortase A system-associated protein [Chlorogloea sp. CCALA 695]
MISKQLRIPLLIFIFAGTTIVLGKLILDPNIGKRQPTPVAFPQNVPLEGWQFQKSEPFISKTDKKGQTVGKPFAKGKYYRYSQNNLLLDIEMVYELESFSAYQQFLSNYSPVEYGSNEQFFVTRQKPGIGTYGMYVAQNRAYLTTCMNSRGGGTLTRQEFNDNRDRYDLMSDRTIPWLLGQRNLRDTRCLWNHFSIPLNKSSPQTAYLILEKAWISWYQWWIVRYPQG